MTILILGNTGMLGSQLYERLEGPRVGLTLGSIRECMWALDQFQPHTVVNAQGVIPARPHETYEMIRANAWFPHAMAALCEKRGVRFIHFSTDCVFSGRVGNYTEQDAPDPINLYGRSKLLGEVDSPSTIVLRTSLIGRTLRGTGLLEWFLRHRGERIPGYTQHFFSGVTTIEAARIVEKVLARPELNGLYHAGGPWITKRNLLELLNVHYGTGTEIVPDSSTSCRRDLDSSRFYRDFGYTPPSWEQMIGELS